MLQSISVPPTALEGPFCISLTVDLSLLSTLDPRPSPFPCLFAPITPFHLRPAIAPLAARLTALSPSLRVWSVVSAAKSVSKTEGPRRPLVSQHSQYSGGNCIRLRAHL
ncbi:uncharacterized protein HMPREF1120_00428 [Exophiala dermatitidis NIH/UT8656]|uniref:Uncharacterized protein n=1 Tax=Exophiala dermatitidis (strain ATCC 34100 / CBS 525.76 / NIH/UT8656) TaxID=858893 RepID=H6BNE3_EXODN|nr:uncharacterized protein HMPREF1120_00428 [Exophiala dermatitidis NIH/UT8656]EHY52213.1 hypothetical protein HMPREF1120_00428 [Exophiala dermatitidis NIH/UT8656]